MASKAGSSYLDFVEGPIARQRHTALRVDQQPVGRSTRELLELKHNSALGAAGARVYNSTTVGTIEELTNRSAARNLAGSPDPSVEPPGMQSPSPALSSFHITDLLERSILIGSHERESNKLRHIIEFYKRQVKNERDIGVNREIMIRNYRLHLVKNAAEEGIDARVRALFTLNRGTSIHVSNSVLKPEIHQFSTKISDRLPELYPVLQGD